jgi:replicative DNA helicase
MLKICKENRIENEKEYLALLLNKPDLFSITQIRPNWMFLKDNQKMMEYCLECYQEHEAISPTKIAEKHKDFNAIYFLELFSETWWHQNAWKEQMKDAEDSIVKFYKEDIIKAMNEKLRRNEIKYDEFMAKMKELDDITLVENSPTLTKQEMLENINANNSRVRLLKFTKLDDVLRMVQGDFLIIGATTGAGKSGLMLNLMNDLMGRYQCIYFNMEMSKSTIYKRLVSIDAQVKVEDVEKPKSEHQKNIINKSLQKIEDCRLVVEHKASDIKQIKSVVAKLKDKERHTILFIDHLGLTKCDGMKSLYEQATEVAKQLRQMCLEYDCTIISASQLNRSAVTSEALNISMLKDSGELENSASKVILLYRDKESDKSSPIVKMNVEVAKNRDGICGNTKMIYNKEQQIFTEVK